MRNLRMRYVQVDEPWTFVLKKQGREAGVTERVWEIADLLAA